jgi:hypothetical protein
MSRVSIAFPGTAAIVAAALAVVRVQVAPSGAVHAGH